MRFSAIASYSAERFVVLPIKCLLNRLRLVCYCQLSKRRSQTDKEEHQSTLEARGIEGIEQTFYEQAGVGVYQGEMVTLQRWVLSRPHQWVIGTLRPLDARLYKKDIVCELLQAALILAHYLQSDVATNHLQNLTQIPLLRNCPRAKEQKNGEGSSSKGHENVECPLRNLIPKKLTPPISQYSVESPRCPFETIIDLLNEGLNQSGKEPFLFKKLSGGERD
jgi:hypothetical protein